MFRNNNVNCPRNAKLDASNNCVCPAGTEQLTNNGECVPTCSPEKKRCGNDCVNADANVFCLPSGSCPPVNCISNDDRANVYTTAPGGDLLCCSDCVTVDGHCCPALLGKSYKMNHYTGDCSTCDPTHDECGTGKSTTCCQDGFSCCDKTCIDDTQKKCVNNTICPMDTYASYRNVEQCCSSDQSRINDNLGNSICCDTESDKAILHPRAITKNGGCGYKCGNTVCSNGFACQQYNLNESNISNVCPSNYNDMYGNIASNDEYSKDPTNYWGSVKSSQPKLDLNWTLTYPNCIFSAQPQDNLDGTYTTQTISTIGECLNLISATNNCKHKNTKILSSTAPSFAPFTVGPDYKVVKNGDNFQFCNYEKTDNQAKYEYSFSNIYNQCTSSNCLDIVDDTRMNKATNIEFSISPSQTDENNGICKFQFQLPDCLPLETSLSPPPNYKLCTIQPFSKDSNSFYTGYVVGNETDCPNNDKDRDLASDRCFYNFNSPLAINDISGNYYDKNTIDKNYICKTITNIDNLAYKHLNDGTNWGCCVPKLMSYVSNNGISTVKIKTTNYDYVILDAKLYKKTVSIKYTSNVSIEDVKKNFEFDLVVSQIASDAIWETTDVGVTTNNIIAVDKHQINELTLTINTPKKINITLTLKNNNFPLAKIEFPFFFINSCPSSSDANKILKYQLDYFVLQNNSDYLSLSENCNDNCVFELKNSNATTFSVLHFDNKDNIGNVSLKNNNSLLINNSINNLNLNLTLYPYIPIANWNLKKITFHKVNNKNLLVDDDKDTLSYGDSIKISGGQNDKYIFKDVNGLLSFNAGKENALIFKITCPQ